MKHSVIRQIFLIVCAFSSALVLASGQAYASTAASEDWSDGPAGVCRGQYVEPTFEAGGDDSLDASADSAEYVIDQVTTLTGNVELRRNEQILKSDTATINTETEAFEATGNVVLRQPGLLIHGDKISGNLFEDTAIIDSASFLIHQRRLRGSAGQINKTNENSLLIRDGEFTTCEPGDTTWTLKSDEIALHSEKGYGVAKDVSLRVKGVPIGYLPYIRFPINESRQSGFLLPSVGQDSDGGTDIALPYYFNLAPNYDATYTLRSIWKRGLMHEGEFRFLNSYSTNIIAGTYLPSDDEYDDRDVIDTTQPDDFSQRDRWLVNVSHRGRKGPWSSRINYTSVSDIDYLRDLGGFTNTDADVDLALDRSDSPALLRAGNLNYRSRHWSSTLELRSYQELNQINTPQFEVLPRLSVRGDQRFDFASTQAEVSGLFQATEFDKPDSTAVVGTRIVADLKAQLPYRKSWGFVIPGVRYIHRSYSLDNTAAGARDDISLSTSMASLDAGLLFERNTRFFGRSVRQTLEPRVHLLFAEEDFQDDLPEFDTTYLTPDFESLFRDNSYTGYDRIEDARRVALGVTSRFANPRTGKEFLAVNLGQAFYSRDRDVTPLSIPGVDPTADTSPVFLSVESRLDRVTLSASYEYDTEESRSNRGHLSLRYVAANDALFNLNYIMTDETQQRIGRARGDEETDVSFAWPLGQSGKWQLVGRWNYNLDDKQTIESLFGVEYNDCCWKARVVFRRNLDEPRRLVVVSPGSAPELIVDRRADSGIYFEFQLKGLASLGGRLDNLLRNAIAGYQTN